MKHIKVMTVQKAQSETVSILQEVFGFVLQLVPLKGKGPTPA